MFCTEPLSPQNLIVTGVEVEAFTISWSLPPEVNYPIAYYLLDLNPDDLCSRYVSINSSREEWEVHDGLVSGREYQASMRSVIIDADNQLIVSFSSVSGIILTTKTQERSLVLTNLTVATGYTITITTFVEGTETGLVKSSAGSLVSLVSTRSAPPQDLVQDEVTSDSITVSWGAPDNAVSMYHILVKDEAGADVDDATVSSSETTYTVENLRPYTKYVITVAAQFNGLDSGAVKLNKMAFQASKGGADDSDVVIAGPLDLPHTGG
nr:tenascin-R-like [Lytechinus pictus]